MFVCDQIVSSYYYGDVFHDIYLSVCDQVQFETSSEEEGEDKVDGSKVTQEAEVVDLEDLGKVMHLAAVSLHDYCWNIDFTVVLKQRYCTRSIHKGVQVLVTWPA